MITSTTEDSLFYITLNRPDKRNALSAELVTAMKQAIQEALDAPSVRIIIIKAEGKVFSAGADLAYLQQLQANSYEENLQDSQHLRGLFQMIYESPKPVIAMVQGDAIAGGCGLATVCDFVFAVPEARFGYTEVRIGFVPALVSVFLLRKIGEGNARMLLLSGELFDAETALKLGLITAVVPAGELDETVKDFATGLAVSNSAQAMAMTKQMIATLQGLPLAAALDQAAHFNAKARGTADCKKGIAAFLDKQKPTW